MGKGKFDDATTEESQQHVWLAIEELKQALNWTHTIGDARIWWLDQERTLYSDPQVILSLLAEILHEESTVGDYFDEQWPLVTPDLIEDFSGADLQQQQRLIPDIEAMKEQIQFYATTGTARRWWNTFEIENLHRCDLILRTLEELANRSATVEEFFLAYSFSDSDNVQQNLDFLDYARGCQQLYGMHISEVPSGYFTAGRPYRRSIPTAALLRFLHVDSSSVTRSVVDVECIENLEDELGLLELGPEHLIMWEDFRSTREDRPEPLLRMLEFMCSSQVSLHELCLAYELTELNCARDVINYIVHLKRFTGKQNITPEDFVGEHGRLFRPAEIIPH